MLRTGLKIGYRIHFKPCVNSTNMTFHRYERSYERAIIRLCSWNIRRTRKKPEHHNDHMLLKFKLR